jgi:hypothetical protein
MKLCLGFDYGEQRIILLRYYERCVSHEGVPMTQTNDKQRGRPKPSGWRPVEPPRELSEWERAMIDRLLTNSFPDHDKIERQLASPLVTHDINSDPSVRLAVDESPENRVSRIKDFIIGTLVSRMEGYDADGMYMFAMLKANDGFVYVLEVQRMGDIPFATLPAPEAFTEDGWEKQERPSHS